MFFFRKKHLFRKTLESFLVFGFRQETWYLGIPTQSGESIPTIFGDHRPRGWCVFGCVSFHLEFQVNIFSDLGQKTILLIVVSNLYAFRASANALWCGDPPYVPPDGTRNHSISLGIPSDSMWNSKWNYLGRYGGPHMTEHLNFSRNHKDTKQLPWEHFFASNHKNMFTWNFTWNHLEFQVKCKLIV